MDSSEVALTALFDPSKLRILDFSHSFFSFSAAGIDLLNFLFQVGKSTIVSKFRGASPPYVSAGGPVADQAKKNANTVDFTAFADEVDVGSHRCKCKVSLH